MKRVAVLLAVPLLLFGEAGVLIPANEQQPDPVKLSLDEMEIRIRIDNGHARVQTKQIFANHTNAALEGKYTFALPGRAMVSDFAVWDDVTRIPGVILERKRADEIYEQARQQVIDPGLLQMGERDADEASRGAVFVARIIPIPAFGTKRIEMEYRERLAMEQMQAYFALPLRPDMYRATVAGRLSVSFELTSPHAMKDFELISKAYPLDIKERTPNRIVATYEGRNVTFSEDLAIRYTIDPAKRDSLAVLTYKENATEPGFFEACVIIGPSTQAATQAPKTIIALFDNSLSMQWEKLERSFLALERLLRGLRPADKFNLILYNSQVQTANPSPVSGDPAAVDRALEFVRSSRLRGGTNLQAALDAALPQATGDAYIVLMSDGGATRGPNIQNVKIADWYAARKKAVNQKAKLYIFAVGDDANLPLLRMLSRDNGLLEWVRSTEPPEFKLNAFLSKIGMRPLEGLTLTTDNPRNFDLIYPLDDAVFPGSAPGFVGQYKAPANRATFSVKAQRDGSAVNLNASVALPAQDLVHDDLPRTWAKARVDALLEKIEREGEDKATIDEIIRLARKYKFVTPYTSFLAAPRALLRPRLIRPGDPVLRVRTDTAIVSVVAMFPFGLVKPLKYLKDEDTWQTRFLAPSDMPDGTHTVRLVLRDKQGRVFRENKTFVIASKPPVVKVRLEKTKYRRGEPIHLKVSASESSRTVIARFTGTSPVSLRWTKEAGASTGELVVPAHLSPGQYPLTVTAEDFAHNIGTQEVTIEVLP